MRQLTTFIDIAEAVEFRGVLSEAGIATQISTESAGPWGLPPRFVIWVADDANQAAIDAVCASLRPDGAKSSATRRTRCPITQQPPAGSRNEAAA